MGYKNTRDRLTWPVQTKLRQAEGKRAERLHRRLGLTQAEWLRGLIEKALAKEDENR